MKISKREMQCVKLVCDGKRNKEIAVELGLTESTVKNYLYVTMKKFNVGNRTELAVKYVTSNFPVGKV